MRVGLFFVFPNVLWFVVGSCFGRFSVRLGPTRLTFLFIFFFVFCLKVEDVWGFVSLL